MATTASGRPDPRDRHVLRELGFATARSGDELGRLGPDRRRDDGARDRAPAHVDPRHLGRHARRPPSGRRDPPAGAGHPRTRHPPLRSGAGLRRRPRGQPDREVGPLGAGGRGRLHRPGRRAGRLRRRIVHGLARPAPRLHRTRAAWISPTTTAGASSCPSPNAPAASGGRPARRCWRIPARRSTRRRRSTAASRAERRGGRALALPGPDAGLADAALPSAGAHRPGHRRPPRSATAWAGSRCATAGTTIACAWWPRAGPSRRGPASRAARERREGAAPRPPDGDERPRSATPS